MKLWGLAEGASGKRVGAPWNAPHFIWERSWARSRESLTGEFWKVASESGHALPPELVAGEWSYGEDLTREMKLK